MYDLRLIDRPWPGHTADRSNYRQRMTSLRRVCMNKRVISAIFITALVAGFAGWWLEGQSDIDACLDAGGRWEKQGSYCVGSVFGPME